MNAHESERLSFMLTRGGLICAPSAEDADILIFQTCSVRNTAAQKILTHISQAKKTGKKICVIGCLSAHKEIKGVDIQLGTNELELLVEKLCGEKPDSRFGIGNSVIITQGCENFCSYCIVPYVRGREYSRNSGDIIAEFEQIKSCGKVVWLLGQNVNSYKCPRTGMDFVGLLDKICALDGDFTVNFMSSHPKDFDARLIDCIARNTKIERNIHLPMQSGCDKILRLMNRKYTVAEYCAKIDALRAAVPGIRITTDIICGFPGETAENFEETMRVFREIKFNAAFIFPYSRREGTHADAMPGQIDDKEKKRRTTLMVEIARKMK